MQVLRTPDERFARLEDYPFEPHYTTITSDDGTALRVHHLDEGPREGPVVLCMHGQPVWSYLYRKMIPFLTGAGLRVIAPDLVGYGRSDKPAAREDFSYERQVNWMGQWLIQNDFKGITFFGQDWGGLIGLRLVAAHPDRFDRVVVSNTGLPHNPDVPQAEIDAVSHYREHGPTPNLFSMSKAVSKMGRSNAALSFAVWQKFCWETEHLPIGLMMSMMTERQPTALKILRALLHRLGLRAPLPSALARGYEAPFPDGRYTMAARAMPSHVPTLPTSPSLEAQAEAWRFFEAFDKPFVCAFSDNDPVTAGLDRLFRERIPGARDQNHVTVAGGGHFIQEMRPREVSQVIIDLIANS